MGNSDVKQMLNKKTEISGPVRVNEGVVRFIGGTDEIIKKIVFRLGDIQKGLDEQGKPVFVKGENPVVTDEGLNRILFFLETVNSEAVKLSKYPDDRTIKRNLRRMFNELAADFSKNCDNWFVDWKKDLNHTYETIRTVSEASIYDALRGHKTKAISQGTNVKEQNVVGGEKVDNRKSRPSFLK